MRITIPITPYTLEKLLKLLQVHSFEGAMIGALFVLMCLGTIILAVWSDKK